MTKPRFAGVRATWFYGYGFAAFGSRAKIPLSCGTGTESFNVSWVTNKSMGCSCITLLSLSLDPKLPHIIFPGIGSKVKKLTTFME